jgi:hypothetical protein
VSRLEELALKVGPLCRCLVCCCKPGTGHKHPDWIDAWGEDNMSKEQADEALTQLRGLTARVDEATEVDEAPELKPMMPDAAERLQWRRESAMRTVVGLIEQQPHLLNVNDRAPSSHLVAAARLVEMAQVIEPYVSGAIDPDDLD